MMLYGICLSWRRCNCVRSNVFCRPIKHMDAGRLYSIDFSIICLTTKIAFAQEFKSNLVNYLSHLGKFKTRALETGKKLLPTVRTNYSPKDTMIDLI